MTTLDDVVERTELERALNERYVSLQRHPSEPYAILNYTQRCQFDRAWDDTTRACRGLIYHLETREVLARPWPKFHNYGEHEEGTLELDAEVIVTDKLDGSLGIAYPPSFDQSVWALSSTGGPHGWAIATRGSFISDQALVGTGLLAGRFFAPNRRFTYLFEIIYPGNRIVVDYGERTELVLLGGVEISTGRPVAARELGGWYGAFVEQIESETLAQALELEPRPNAEGVVIQYVDPPYMMVKVKQDEYVRLHRIVTGMNERTVWELLGEKRTIEEIKAPLPEEFWPWVDKVAAELVDSYLLLTERLGQRYEAVQLVLGWDPLRQLTRVAPERKDFALAWIAATEDAPELRPFGFVLYDGKNPRDGLWRLLRPVDPRSLVTTAEAS